MYAIIQTGGKQYRVAEGDVVRVEKLPAAPGEEVTFDRVLAVKKDGVLRVGSPLVQEARAVARVLEQGRGKKIRGFKFKSKVNYRRRYGHRQPFTALRIERIEA